jgi:hypothetical protein
MAGINAPYFRLESKKQSQIKTFMNLSEAKQRLRYEELKSKRVLSAIELGEFRALGRLLMPIADEPFTG